MRCLHHTYSGKGRDKLPNRRWADKPGARGCPRLRPFSQPPWTKASSSTAPLPRASRFGVCLGPLPGEDTLPAPPQASGRPQPNESSSEGGKRQAPCTSGSSLAARYVPTQSPPPVPTTDPLLWGVRLPRHRAPFHKRTSPGLSAGGSRTLAAGPSVPSPGSSGLHARGFLQRASGKWRPAPRLILPWRHPDFCAFLTSVGYFYQFTHTSGDWRAGSRKRRLGPPNQRCLLHPVAQHSSACLQPHTARGGLHRPCAPRLYETLPVGQREGPKSTPHVCKLNLALKSLSQARGAALRLGGLA